MRKILVSLVGLLCLLTLCLQGVQARQGDMTASSQGAIEPASALHIVVAQGSDLQGTAGQIYHATFQAVRGKAPYKWKSTKFQLPTWLGVTAIVGDSVSVMGTPPARGSYSLELFVKDHAGNKFTGTFVIVVGDPLPPLDFGVMCDPLSKTIDMGDIATYTVATQGFNGFKGSVHLTTQSSPSGLSITLSSQNVVVNDSATLKVVTTANTVAGTYTITVTGDAPGTPTSDMHSASCTLIVNPKQHHDDPVHITDNEIPGIYDGDTDMIQLNAVGGSGEYTWSLDSMSTTAKFCQIDPGTGVLTRAPRNVPNTPNYFNVTINLSDKNNGANNTKKFFGFLVHSGAVNNGVDVQVNGRVFKTNDPITIQWKYPGSAGKSYTAIVYLVNYPSTLGSGVTVQQVFLTIANGAQTVGGQIQTISWKAFPACSLCPNDTYQIFVTVQDPDSGQIPSGHSADLTILRP